MSISRNVHRKTASVSKELTHTEGKNVHRSRLKIGGIFTGCKGSGESIWVSPSALHVGLPSLTYPKGLNFNVESTGECTMSDVFSLFDEEVDASKFDKVNEDKGKTLSDLIRQSMKIDEEIAQAEQYLKDLKFKKRKVNEEDIPSLMQEMGMDSVTVDGNKVALRQFVHARIPEEKKDEAYNWLRSIGEVTSRMMSSCPSVLVKIRRRGPRTPPQSGS